MRRNLYLLAPREVLGYPVVRGRVVRERGEILLDIFWSMQQLWFEVIPASIGPD